MASIADPTVAIRKQAEKFPAVTQGTSCNQSSFKTGKSAFLFIGPGAKGQGFKAMFKLDRSMAQARKLAASAPDRFQVGSTGWVTTRFTSEAPLPKRIWDKWLRESYELTCDSAPKSKKKPVSKNNNKATKKPSKKTTAKKTTVKKKRTKKRPS